MPAALPQPQRFFSPNAGIRGSQPRWPQQGRGGGGAQPHMMAMGGQFRGRSAGAPRMSHQAGGGGVPRPGMPGAGGPMIQMMQGRPGMPPQAMQQMAGSRPQGFKYTPNVRNQSQVAVMPQQMPPQPAAAAPHAVMIQGQEPLTSSMLAAAAPQDQKQMLGERLFPLIQRMYPELAGKITGMLLEIDNSELLHMLEHHESLKGKVDEAVAVLQAHQNKPAPASASTEQAQ